MNKLPCVITHWPHTKTLIKLKLFIINSDSFILSKYETDMSVFLLDIQYIYVYIYTHTHGAKQEIILF